MPTDTPDNPEVAPAPAETPAETAPEPTAVVDHTPDPLAALQTETPAPPLEEVAAADHEEPAPPPTEEEPAPPAPDEPATPLAAEETPADEAAVEVKSGEEEPADQKPADEKPADKPRNPNLRWYVVKVQSGREDSIKEAIERRVKIEGVEPYFGQVVVPVEREVVVIQTGKRKGQKQIRKKKKFPGYIMAEVEYNEPILYLFRETSGVGDFVGGSLTRAPQPMSDREVQAMLSSAEEPTTEKGKKGEKGKPVIVAPKKLPYGVGDRVKVRDGTFQNMEGEVKQIREPKDPKDAYQIDVELTVWGRPVKVQLDYWQLDPV